LVNLGLTKSTFHHQSKFIKGEIQNDWTFAAAAATAIANANLKKKQINFNLICATLLN
jgi:hypothetical protein